jgi:CopA family copper-resistance protein
MIELDRRHLLSGSLSVGGALGASALFPSWARAASSLPNSRKGLDELSGDQIDLAIGKTNFAVEGRSAQAVTINGTLPGPLIRLTEGQNVRLSVTNNLEEDSSIHWHGLLVPFQFDGVPGVSFPGIKPGETFHYEFPIRQSGTYWYHSHSGTQEQDGHYGPIIIDPSGKDPITFDREYMLVLSDWSPLGGHMIMKKLKQQSDYFNYDKQTFASLLAGEGQTLEQRLKWGKMRMSAADISDVTGSTYSYMINGHGPQENWTGLFRPGERVRLRIVNASAMSIFNVRIPGLKLEVVQADGQNIVPVQTDELQISVAETYDVIVTPTENKAFNIIGESVDRSGMARATLAPAAGMVVPLPALRERPTLTMKDMGMGAMGAKTAPMANDKPMDHAAMGHGTEAPGSTDMAGMDMPGMDMGRSTDMSGMDMSGSAAPMNMRDTRKLPPKSGTGPGVATVAPMPVDRIGDRGLGLDDVKHDVLVYTDLVALEPGKDRRRPSRELEIHLTSNMERYMWSLNGNKFSAVTDDPIRFARNERVRVKLVNDTMMSHPIHLHGHFFELVNGQTNQPRKHTVNVLPGGFVQFDLTADEPGDWAFHCHLLYHMEAGMFQVVTVRPLDGDAA